MSLALIMPMKVVVIMLLLAFALPYAAAETVQMSSSGGSLLISVTPADSGFVMEFLNPDTNRLQQHVDYTVEVSNGETQIFGPIPLTHTTPGKVTIPAELADGTNIITVAVRGILFVPLPEETAQISVVLGSKDTIPSWIKSTAGWWANGELDDASFLTSIKYLLDNNIIQVQTTLMQGGSGEIPGWIKNTAGWWADGTLADSEFLNVIVYLVENGIITVDGGGDDAPMTAGINLRYASPPIGDDDAPITIIEFGDYQCPNCERWFSSTKPIIESEYISTGQAQLYFVDLAFIGSDSHMAAAATYCAQDQGLYWEYHDTLYQNQGGIQNWISHNTLVSYAESLGMDTQTFAECLDGDHTERIQFNYEQAVSAGFDSTPAFVIAGPGGVQTIKGNQPVAVFDDIIMELLN